MNFGKLPPLEERWPGAAELRVGLRTRVRVIEAKRDRLKPDTTGMIVMADCWNNKVAVCVNPAIGWVGTYQEFVEMWEVVPDGTAMTF